MKALNFIKKELRESLLKGIDKTIDSLKDILPTDGDKHQNLLLLELRLKEINKKVINGTISEEESQLAKNKIRESLILLINELKDNDLGMSGQANPPPAQRAASSYQSSRQRGSSESFRFSNNIVYGLLGILLILVIWVAASQFSSDENPTVTPPTEPGTEHVTEEPPTRVEETKPVNTPKPAEEKPKVTTPPEPKKDDRIVRDSDGTSYETIQISGKTWTAENLAFENANSWYFDNISSKRKGRLYTWDSAQRACQSLGNGWRLPSKLEWETLLNQHPKNTLFEGGGSGLNLIIGGCRSSKQEFINPETAYYWTNNSEGAGASYITFGNGNFNILDKNWGFSCRCLKNR